MSAHSPIEPSPNSRKPDIPEEPGEPQNKEQGSGQQLPQQIAKLFNAVPEEEREELLSNVLEQVEFDGRFGTTTMTHTRFSGPFPHPDILSKFNEIAPGSAQQIIDMAVSQTKHRQHCEKTVIESQLRQSGRGQIFGFISAILAIIATVYLALNNQTAVAGILGGGTALGIASIFALGKNTQKKGLEDKAES
jgi:uncharacterized membrane protein